MSATALRIVEGSSMDKTKALSAALSQIERQFGKGSVMKLGKNDRSMDIETISSGSLGLDIALGVGGLPRGRVVEIYGPESSGKTTLALHTVAEGQKKGGICAFIDAEHALDPVYARKLGVNIDELLISQPDTGEQALEICDGARHAPQHARRPRRPPAGRRARARRGIDCARARGDGLLDDRVVDGLVPVEAPRVASRPVRRDRVGDGAWRLSFTDSRRPASRSASTAGDLGSSTFALELGSRRGSTSSSWARSWGFSAYGMAAEGRSRSRSS